jgi:hypothetical protein
MKGERIFEKNIMNDIKEKGLNEEEVIRKLIRSSLIPEAKDEESDDDKLNAMYF